MASLREIDKFLSKELELDIFDDASLNGIQVEGAEEVSSIAVAVDAGVETIERARDAGAQLLLVHHGLFWGVCHPVADGLKKSLHSALNADLSIYAAHLPLDAHQTYGNNFALARLLGLSETSQCAKYKGQLIGCRGVNASKKSRDDFVSDLAGLPGANPQMLSLPFGPKIPEKVVIISGAGADELYNFKTDDFDTLITGEPRQFAYHFAKEHGLNVIFAGHYATETVGVQELGKALEKQFGIAWQFIDVPTNI